ncbi:MAG: 3-hydroxyacyl-CoA dehydrogenase NAD-binding domain-containing protein [Gammaproteobacteria bacterium]
MNASVSSLKRGVIGIITIDNPPVNAASHAVRSGIVAAVQALDRDPEVAAIVLCCAGRTFIAGADISEFDKPPQEPGLPETLAVVEAASKPVVAAIHGTALGGGLETALACHYRVAAPTAQVGLPEVKLGILPGAGGTQRLPRLAGVRKALDMIVSGDPIPARDAKQHGIVDELIEGDLLAGAIAYAEQVVARKAPLRKVRDIPIDTPPAGFFADYRNAIARQTRGFYAPERCVQAFEAAVHLPFEEGLMRERQLFLECKNTVHSRAQRHLFFAERAANKVPGVGKDTPRRPIHKVAVIGAGTMGGGIAMTFANAGIPVALIERAVEPLQRGLDAIRKNYEAGVRKGKLTDAHVAERMARIRGEVTMAAAADADLIIEAVFEDMAVKKAVFAELDAIAKPGAILASNTSTLDLDAIAAATRRPEDVVGLHFFSPANVMRLLEIVRGAGTGVDVVATCVDLAKNIRKVGVLVGVCYGFVGNRMLEGYMREADALLLEGATPEQVDQALFDFGFAMGPFTMIDMAGVDIGFHTREQNRQRLPKIPNYCVVSDALARMGRFGQKTGKGFYRYEKGERTPLPDTEVAALIEAKSQELGIVRRTIGNEEILKRCLYPLINEGALILEEGIALRPGDIDVIWATGYGFPLYRGGPMFYADTVGLDAILATLRTYQDALGAHWRPAPLLEKLAREGKRFGEFAE